MSHTKLVSHQISLTALVEKVLFTFGLELGVIRQHAVNWSFSFIQETHTSLRVQW